jgi:hypothetical protein
MEKMFLVTGVQPDHRYTTLVVRILIYFSYQIYDFRRIDIYLSFILLYKIYFAAVKKQRK